jgi:peptidyl-prolyl cis-trans isomerase C
MAFLLTSRAMPSFLSRLLTVFIVVLPLGAGAQGGAPTTPAAVPGTASPGDGPSATSADTVLISNGSVSLTRGDYDLELSRLPADSRAGFGVDPSRVNSLLNKMLVGKTMAAQARAAGIDKRPETQQRMAFETERLLALLYMESLEAEFAKEFNARPGIEAAARERWLADADKYRTPETASVTQILFSLSKHSKDEALKLAQDARARVQAGADMNALAKEVSEDPAAKRNAGRIEDFTREQADPAFARASFALRNPGDLSEPVLSRFGYHVIRLDGKRPAKQRAFPEVKDAIIADMRSQYVDQRRNERLAAIRNDPKIVVNEPAVEALVVRIDLEAVQKAAEQANPGSPASAQSATTPAPK